jgi:hypothetical protein
MYEQRGTGTIGGIFANTYSQLSQSTLPELWEVFNKLGFEHGKDYVYNEAPPAAWNYPSRFKKKHDATLTVRYWGQCIVRSLDQPETIGGVAVPNGIAVVWGLTRAGEWMLAEVHYHGEAGYKWRGYERAHTVHIRVVELVDVLQRTKETPEKILKALGEEVRAWVNHRRGLYNAAKALGDRISNEDMLFDLIDR